MLCRPLVILKSIEKYSTDQKLRKLQKSIILYIKSKKGEQQGYAAAHDIDQTGFRTLQYAM